MLYQPDAVNTERRARVGRSDSGAYAQSGRTLSGMKDLAGGFPVAIMGLRCKYVGEGTIMRTMLILVGCLLSVSMVTAADEIVSVYVDGKQVAFKPDARVRDGKAYAPLRETSEAFGAKVEWNPQAQMAIICSGPACVPIKKSDGIIVNSQLLVPLRVLGEALGAKVAWDAAGRAVRITSPPKFAH